MENTILNEEQSKQKQPEQEQPVMVWKLKPVDHKLMVICAFLSAAMLILGILLLWGKLAAAVVTVLMIPLGIYIHYKLQRRIKMERATIYLDSGEMFLIFLDKADTELRKYLNGELDVDRAGRKPEEILVDLAEWSVLCHITQVCNILEKREKKFILCTFYELLPYAYSANLEIPVTRKCFENYDTLMEFAHVKLAQYRKK